MLLWRERRGGGSQQGSHSNVRACDSGDTWSHLSAVYTFLSWSLSYRGDHLSYSKKESKQASDGCGGGPEGGGRWREGWMEGWREGGREEKEARDLCVNAGRDCKASWAMTAKCANFLQGTETLSHSEGSRSCDAEALLCLFRSLDDQFYQDQFVGQQGWAFMCLSTNSMIRRFWVWQ